MLEELERQELEKTQQANDKNGYQRMVESLAISCAMADLVISAATDPALTASQRMEGLVGGLSAAHAANDAPAMVSTAFLPVALVLVDSMIQCHC